MCDLDEVALDRVRRGHKTPLTDEERAHLLTQAVKRWEQDQADRESLRDGWGRTPDGWRVTPLSEEDKKYPVWMFLLAEGLGVKVDSLVRQLHRHRARTQVAA